MAESKNSYVELLIRNRITKQEELVYLNMKHMFNVSVVALVVDDRKKSFYANCCHFYTKKKRCRFDLCDIVSIKDVYKPNLLNKVFTHDDL